MRITLLLFLSACSSLYSLATAPTIGITSFNSNFTGAVSLLAATNSPGSVANVGSSGWDFSVTSPGGQVSMSVSGSGADPGGTNDYCIRLNRNTGGDYVTQISIKSDDGSAFSLQYVYLKVNLFAGGATSADMTITGYRAGVAVPGAVKTITGILTNPVWTQFDVSSVLAFGNVDEFRFTQAASSSALISFEVIDQIDIATAVPLPLILTNFSGHLNNGNDVLLGWTTSSEENTSYFEVQRSTSVSPYAPIAKIDAAGNSNQPLQYQYTDVLPPAPAPSYFYRLKMADLDGHFTYSPVVEIDPSPSGLAISASPNPFQQQVTITVTSATADIATLSLIDMSGRNIFVQAMPIQKGSNTLILPSMGTLGKGVYLLKVSTKSKKQTIQILKGG